MKVTITREVCPDDDADASYLEQEGYEDRLAQYRRGQLGFVGVRARAVLTVPSAQGGYWTSVVICSPGIWSIEDDSDNGYLDEVYAEEVETLKEMLRMMQTSAIEYVE